MYQNLVVTLKNKLALITINRPEKMNALNHATLSDLSHCMDHCLANDEVKAIMISGAGDKSFVAGADISELQALSPDDAIKASRFGQSVFNKIEQSSKPVLAVVNGFALGGGCELAMSCHLRFASEHAKFGQPEVNLGLIPGYGGTQRLSRLVGTGKAIELSISGIVITADEAYRIGLVNKVYPQEKLMDECEKFLTLVLSKGPLAVSYTIQAIVNGRNMSIEDAFLYEAALFGLIKSSQDAERGCKAFINKENAQFIGK